MSAPPPQKPRPPLPEGPFLVVGLARSGCAAARLLVGRGEQVRGVDSGHPEEAAGLAGEGVEVVLDTDGLALLDGTRTVVKSPGVPREAPVIAAALERGIDVMGEMELAWRAIPNRFLAVTGTNGKTTVAELLGHVYRTAGEPVAVAGNVGTPLASLAAEVEPDATVVCEASSFQLEDSVAFAPECAVFLNLAPDHLDRHADLDSYLAAKLRVFANQGNDDVAVYNADEPALAGVDLGGCARRVSSASAPLPTARSLSPRARSSTRASRSSASPSWACSAPTTSPTRWPPPRRRWRWGSIARRCARGCAASPASRTGSSRSPSSTASASSTTPRRPTSPPPRSACAPSRAGSTRSSAAARRARTSRRSPTRSASPAPPST